MKRYTLLPVMLLLSCMTHLQAQSTTSSTTPANTNNMIISPDDKAGALAALLLLSGDQLQRLTAVFAQEQSQFSAERATALSASESSQAQIQLAFKFQAVLSSEQLAVYSAKYPYSYWAVKPTPSSAAQARH